MSKPTVVVTGASKGIGLAITAVLLRKFGARVIAISRSKTTELDGLASDDLVPVQCDVADEAALTKVISGIERVDGLVLNAGVLDPLCRIGDNTPLESWKSHFDVNFFSLVTAVRAALPALRKSEGRIVFVSSGAAVKGTAGWGPYNASKAAMNSLCRTLAEEEPLVTSIALRPGMVDTAMQVMVREDGAISMSADDHKKFIKVNSDGALLPPHYPGHVIAALSLRAPRALSGHFVSWDDDKLKEYRGEEDLDAAVV